MIHYSNNIEADVVNTERDKTMTDSIFAVYFTQEQLDTLKLLTEEYLFQGGNAPGIAAETLEQAMNMLRQATPVEDEA